MNKTLAKEGRRILKELLSNCSNEQQVMFKRMYSHKNLQLPINDVIEQMNDDKIDWAITQCERTVEKNNKKW